MIAALHGKTRNPPLEVKIGHSRRRNTKTPCQLPSWGWHGVLLRAAGKSVLHAHGLAHLVKGGWRCDFEGWLCGSGRVVALEAKTSHASPSWPLGDVLDDQALRLSTVARDGGLALLYVQRWHEGRATDYLLPVDAQGVIAALAAHPALVVMSGERKSIRWADLEPWRVGSQELWLDAAERLLGGV